MNQAALTVNEELALRYARVRRTDSFFAYELTELRSSPPNVNWGRVLSCLATRHGFIRRIKIGDVWSYKITGEGSSWLHRAGISALRANTSCGHQLQEVRDHASLEKRRKALARGRDTNGCFVRRAALGGDRSTASEHRDVQDAAGAARRDRVRL